MHLYKCKLHLGNCHLFWLTGDATLALVPLMRRCEGAVGQVLGSLLPTIKQQQQQRGGSRSDLRRRRVQEMGHLAPGKTNVLLPMPLLNRQQARYWMDTKLHWQCALLHLTIFLLDYAASCISATKYTAQQQYVDKKFQDNLSIK